jgi:hypothetical protein
MAGTDRAANFVVKAKDAATGPLGKIGGAMGKLKHAAGTAFKAIAAGAVAAALAVGAFVVDAIKQAADDEKSTNRLMTALKARGMATKEVTAAVNESIKAGIKLGFTDDQVKTSLEEATRFTHSFSKAQKIMRVAQDVSRATGVDLATATLNVGKAYAGAGGRLLKTLGITDKKIKGDTALEAIQRKVTNAAKAYADTVAGRVEVAQASFNQIIQNFAENFLPAMVVGLTFITDKVLPMLAPALDKLANIIFTVGGAFADIGASIGKVVGPILIDLKPAFDKLVDSVGGFVESVGHLIAVLWGDGDGALGGAFKLLGGTIKAAFELAAPFFDALKWLVDNITKVIDAIQKVAGAQTVEKNAAAANKSTVFGLGTTVGGTTGAAVSGALTSGYGGMLAPTVAAPMNLTSNTTLTLDGRTLATAISPYLASKTRTTVATGNNGRGR